MALFHTVLAPSFGIGIFLASFWLTLTRLKYLPVLLAAVMPFVTLKWFSVVDLLPSTMANFGFLIGLCFRGTIDQRLQQRIFVNKWLALFVILLLLSALFGYTSLLELDVPGISFFRNPQGRTLTQVLSLLVRASLLQLAVLSITTIAIARNVFKTMLVASALLLVVGIYELTAFYVGLPWIGIIRADPALSGPMHIAGINLLDDRFIPRLASLAGEPKILAQQAVPIIFLIVISQSYRIDLGRYLTSRFFLYALLVLLFLTYSTSGWLGFLISFLVIMLLLLRRARRSAGTISTFILGIGGLLFLMGTISGTAFLVEIFGLRLFGPLLDVMSFWSEQRASLFDITLKPEAAAIDWIAQNPSALILGVGPGNGHFHIAPLIDHPLTAIVAINSGVVRELLEWGALGLIAFYGLHISAIRDALIIRSRRGLDSNIRGYLAIALALDISSLILDWFYSTEALGQLWFFLGILIALTRIARSQINS